MNTKKNKIQWHPGFYSGYQLDLAEYKDILERETEHELKRIIVTSRLGDGHPALKVLDKDASVGDINRFIDFSSKITEKDDKENADAVLEVSNAANRYIYEKIWRDKNMMGPTLRELMKDDLEEREAKGREEGRDMGVKAVVKTCKSFGGSSIDAIEQVVASLGFSRAEADKLVSKYW